jgi:hypothetical protein
MFRQSWPGDDGGRDSRAQPQLRAIIRHHGVAFVATIVSERADDPGSCTQKICLPLDPASPGRRRMAGAKVINLARRLDAGRAMLALWRQTQELLLTRGQ